MYERYPIECCEVNTREITLIIIWSVLREIATLVKFIFNYIRG